MASIIPKKSFLNRITSFVPSTFGQDVVDIAGKAFRAKIIYDRNFRGFQKDARNNNPNNYDFERPAHQRPEFKPHQKLILNSRGDASNDVPLDSYQSEPSNTRVSQTVIKDSVSIIDIDSIPNWVDDKYYSSITLPFVPQKLSYNPNSEFTGIASFGRNNPFYHYAGSEDVLTFSIDWFSKLNNRQDVIYSCRWLESLSKANSYEETPHRVVLSWGNDNLLFADSIWIVASAPYELQDFVNAYKEGGIITKVGLLPQQAFQNITLKRVTENNLSTDDILGNLKPSLNEQQEFDRPIQ